MSRDDLEELEAVLMKLLVRTRSLGGYDAHATNDLVVHEAMLRMVQHLKDKESRPKKGAT